MKKYPVQSKVDGHSTYEKPLQEIGDEAPLGGALLVLTPLEHHTDQQRKWFKGVLLKALSEDNGESVRQWEIKLISAIFPDDVEYHACKNQVYLIVPSISSYGKHKMSILIDESVAMCQDWGFTWVTHPDPELRK